MSLKKEKMCCFSGHRPDLLYGWDLSDSKYQYLAKVLKKIARKLVLEDGYTAFMTGGALGLDTVAFFAIESLKKEIPYIKNILALPFENQDSIWKNPVDVERYSRMKQLADEIVYVDKIKGYIVPSNILSSKDTIRIKLDKRNQYMVDCSTTLIAVWNLNKSRGTYNCISYANDKSHIENIIVVKSFKPDEVFYYKSLEEQNTL